MSISGHDPAAPVTSSAEPSPARPDPATPDPARPDPAGPRSAPAGLSPEAYAAVNRDRLGISGLRPVSPDLVRARLLAGIVGDVIGLLLIAGCIVLWLLLDWWWMIFPAVLVLVLVLQAVLLTPRRVRAIGYLDREEDLVVASGIMFRSLETVAFGRVQSVEVHEGPIERSLGLASLSVSTAAGEADVSLPGLPREEAERLRELLTRRGVELMAAL
ncbi:PH domain-containing protein [Brachybacterium hainanense]|uniref:PH domain-containing protein n=1 Tax=Brachybacterium hainanense TaxID=1541174 RepID=A0ABV6RCG6_9MICO